MERKRTIAADSEENGTRKGARNERRIERERMSSKL